MKAQKSEKLRNWLREHSSNPKKLRKWLETQSEGKEHALAHIIHDRSQDPLRTQILRQFKIK